MIFSKELHINRQTFNLHLEKGSENSLCPDPEKEESIRIIKYKFDPEKIKDYHRQNLEDAIKSMEAGISPVIIDNTNVQKWEFEKYLDAAEVNGYDVKFETLDPTNYSEDFIRELAERQKKTHNVPEQVIIDMLKRWED